jgi:hypothetical protein
MWIGQIDGKIGMLTILLLLIVLLNEREVFAHMALVVVLRTIPLCSQIL